MSYLRYLHSFAYIALCVLIWLSWSLILYTNDSLDCPFLIVPLVPLAFSNGLVTII